MTALRKPAKAGFGTEVLTRMLPYELKADVSLSFESDGVLCSMRIPQTQGHGHY